MHDWSSHDWRLEPNRPNAGEARWLKAGDSPPSSSGGYGLGDGDEMFLALLLAVLGPAVIVLFAVGLLVMAIVGPIRWAWRRLRR